MLKQKDIVTKTASVTLGYDEIGDIICNSTSGITITLPSPFTGMWYRINNVNNGTVTIYYDSNLTTINKNEFCMCYANTTIGWLFTKSGGTITKEAVESVLTGEITSHTHAIPQATLQEYGGIKAKLKTDENAEVAIDVETGKLYVKIPNAILGTSVITTTNWVSSLSGYGNYELDIPIEMILETDRVAIQIDESYKSIVDASEISQTIDSYNGGIKIYCNIIPTEEIPFDFFIINN